MGVDSRRFAKSLGQPHFCEGAAAELVQDTILRSGTRGHHIAQANGMKAPHSISVDIFDIIVYVPVQGEFWHWSSTKSSCTFTFRSGRQNLGERTFQTCQTSQHKYWTNVRTAGPVTYWGIEVLFAYM